MRSNKARIVLAVVVAIALIYAGEDLSLRYRIPRGRQVLGAVTVQRYDAIPKKNGKVEFAYEEPVSETCVHALFPHLGYAPCWYLQRHSEQRIGY